MPHKTEVMAVDIGDTIAVYSVKRAKLARPEAAQQKVFLCLHCEGYSAVPWFEIRQDGFFDDKYQLICHCGQCLQLSAYEFEVKHDNETA